MGLGGRRIGKKRAARSTGTKKERRREDERRFSGAKESEKADKSMGIGGQRVCQGSVKDGGQGSWVRVSKRAGRGFNQGEVEGAEKEEKEGGLGAADGGRRSRRIRALFTLCGGCLPRDAAESKATASTGESRAKPLFPRRAGCGSQGRRIEAGWDRDRHRRRREEPLRDGGCCRVRRCRSCSGCGRRGAGVPPGLRARSRCGGGEPGAVPVPGPPGGRPFPEADAGRRLEAGGAQRPPVATPGPPRRRRSLSAPSAPPPAPRAPPGGHGAALRAPGAALTLLAKYLFNTMEFFSRFTPTIFPTFPGFITLFFPFFVEDFVLRGKHNLMGHPIYRLLYTNAYNFIKENWN